MAATNTFAVFLHMGICDFYSRQLILAQAILRNPKAPSLCVFLNTVKDV